MFRCSFLLHYSYCIIVLHHQLSFQHVAINAQYLYTLQGWAEHRTCPTRLLFSGEHLSGEHCIVVPTLARLLLTVYGSMTPVVPNMCCTVHCSQVLPSVFPSIPLLNPYPTLTSKASALSGLAWSRSRGACAQHCAPASQAALPPARPPSGPAKSKAFPRSAGTALSLRTHRRLTRLVRLISQSGDGHAAEGDVPRGRPRHPDRHWGARPTVRVPPHLQSRWEKGQPQGIPTDSCIQ